MNMKQYRIALKLWEIEQTMIAIRAWKTENVKQLNAARDRLKRVSDKRR